jgi:ArsR family transcriptional regulator, zinc-responsive transcriptional repressor
MRADSQLPRLRPEIEQVTRAVETFQMLADPTRVRLLWELLDRERSVNELATAVDKSPSAVSQHLAKLRAARLVSTRRQGNQIFYRIENAHVSQLVEDGIYQAEHTSDGVPRHHRPDGELREHRQAHHRSGTAGTNQHRDDR